MSKRFANGFDHPPDFAERFMGEQATASCLFLRIGALAPSPPPSPAGGLEKSQRHRRCGKAVLGCATQSLARG